MKKSYHIRTKLGEVLERKQITQRELSSLTGIRAGTISEIVRGTKSCLNFEHFSKIAMALQIEDLRELVDFDDEE